ncbi:MAG: carbohydrate ABC transporter permease [Fidelibacterota bacterium]
MRRSSIRAMILKGFKIGILLILTFLYISPILFMVVGSLKPDERVMADSGSLKAFVPAEASFQNYVDVFERVNFGRFMLNSIIITGSIVLIGLLINSMAGYAFARLRWKGRDVLFVGVVALMILPFESIAAPLFFQITRLGWRDTYLAQILPFIANAMSIYLFYSFFIGMPRQLEEAARIDGAGVFRTFAQIIVPNAKPVFATVAIVTFLMYWGFFLWPLMITSGEAVRPLPVAIATFRSLPPLKWGDIMAFGVMMVTPVLGLFLLFQKWFVKGITQSGIKG